MRQLSDVRRDAAFKSLCIWLEVDRKERPSHQTACLVQSLQQIPHTRVRLISYSCSCNADPPPHTHTSSKFTRVLKQAHVGLTYHCRQENHHYLPNPGNLLTANGGKIPPKLQAKLSSECDSSAGLMLYSCGGWLWQITFCVCVCVSEWERRCVCVRAAVTCWAQRWGLWMSVDLARNALLLIYPSAEEAETHAAVAGAHCS